MIRIHSLYGDELVPHLAALAALRVEVFREFPYLYQGSIENEAKYLRGYGASPQSLVVLAQDGEEVVGASTAMPATAHTDEVGPVLAAAGYDASKVYYYGESVLRASYRGRGLGRAFMDAREAAARRFGFTTAAFCAVVRPADHPARPSGYAPLDAFWQRCGFVRRPDIVTQFEWLDVGDDAPSPKALVFWLKELG
ncbi:MAG: GNAT family N-acetyltransferase [Kofleriaceae bacterium]